MNAKHRLTRSVSSTKPITFSMELAGNAEQVAATLRKVASLLESGQKSGVVKDEDEEVVGTFWLEPK